MASPCGAAELAAHPGNNYYVNGVTGTIQRASGVTRIIVGPASGFSGPYNWCQAKAFAENRSFSGFGHGSAEANIGNIAVGDLFHGLDLPHILLRVGEIALGIVLIAVGVAKLTGASNYIGDAFKVAAKVPL